MTDIGKLLSFTLKIADDAMQRSSGSSEGPLEPQDPGEVTMHEDDFKRELAVMRKKATRQLIYIIDELHEALKCLDAGQEALAGWKLKAALETLQEIIPLTVKGERRG